MSPSNEVSCTNITWQGQDRVVGACRACHQCPTLPRSCRLRCGQYRWSRSPPACQLGGCSQILLAVCCFLLLLIVSEQNGSSLMSLELRPALTRQGSRRSLHFRLCLFLTWSHHPREHTRRQRKWCHVCHLCSKGISTSLDGIWPPLFQSAQACHDHRLRCVHAAHHRQLVSTKDREEIGRCRTRTEC